jgi:hypothetical protein
MAITQDGSHKFGIPDSPLNVGGVTYVAEELTVEIPSNEVVIADDEGIETGRVIIPLSKRITGTMQLPNANAAIPAIGANFVANVNNVNTNFILTSISDQQAQAQFAKMSFTAVERIN